MLVVLQKAQMRHNADMSRHWYHHNFGHTIDECVALNIWNWRTHAVQTSQTIGLEGWGRRLMGWVEKIRWTKRES